MKRPGSMSDDDRALAARHTRVRGVPVLSDPDDTSPMQTIEERVAIRRKRPPSDRLEHLEKRVDDLGADHHALALLVAGTHGKLDTLVSYAAASDEERARRAAADAVAAEKREQAEVSRLAARRKHLIALIGALAGGAAIVIAALAQGCL